MLSGGAHLRVFSAAGLHAHSCAKRLQPGLGSPLVAAAAGPGPGPGPEAAAAVAAEAGMVEEEVSRRVWWHRCGGGCFPHCRRTAARSAPCETMPLLFPVHTALSSTCCKLSNTCHSPSCTAPCTIRHTWRLISRPGRVCRWSATNSRCRRHCGASSLLQSQSCRSWLEPQSLWWSPPALR